MVKVILNDTVILHTTTSLQAHENDGVFSFGTMPCLSVSRGNGTLTTYN